MPAPIAICYALTELFDAVVTRFENDGTAADQSLGWREPQKHKTSTARIVWVPGDESGNAGAMAPSKNRSGPPRSLATLEELFHVRISANDPTAPEDERAQYVATRTLFDAWVRAVYLAAHGTIRFGSPSWNTSKNERRHGAELICVCMVEAKIPDAPVTLAPVDAEAVTAMSLEDVTETVSTTAP